MHQEKFNNLQPQRPFQWANAILTAPIELDWPLLMQWILGVDDNFFFFSKFILGTYLLKMAYKGLYIKEIQVSGCTFRNFVDLLVATTTPNEYQSNYGSPVSRLSNYFPCCSITFFLPNVFSSVCFATKAAVYLQLPAWNYRWLPKWYIYHQFRKTIVIRG